MNSPNSLDDFDLARLNGQRDHLLAQKTILISALDEDGMPEMGVTPMIVVDGVMFIYPSRLSGHVRALLARSQGQFMLIEDEAKSSNIWARNRLKFNAEIHEIARDDPSFNVLCDSFTAAHGPTMQLIRDFTDFHMLRLRPKDGVMVTGFAKAFALSGDDLTITEHLKQS